VAWIVRLVKIGADCEERFADVMTINRPDDLDDIANLGLTVADGKRVLAGLQQEIIVAQARSHSVRRPVCQNCSGVCHLKDYRNRAVATHLGQVTVRLLSSVSLFDGPLITDFDGLPTSASRLF
jgi:hypothetical protein